MRCSTHNAELVRSIGAAHVIDYTREDFTDGRAHYDVILDNVSSLPLIEDGKLTPVVDRTYPLADTAEGLRHVEQGHARGKIVVTVA